MPNRVAGLDIRRRYKPICPCPIYCRYCGAKRKRDAIGHKCPTHNCQWQFGYSTCTLHKKKVRAASTRTDNG